MGNRKITTLRIVNSLDELLAKEAAKKGVSKNAVITEALWQYIKPNKGSD